MGTGTDLQRRKAFERLRFEMGHRTEYFSREKRNSASPDVRLVNAQGMLWSALDLVYGHHEHPLMSEVAAHLGVNDELTRLILLGKREPSKAFLNAIGYERVTLYRLKEPSHD